MSVLHQAQNPAKDHTDDVISFPELPTQYGHGGWASVNGKSGRNTFNNILYGNVDEENDDDYYDDYDDDDDEADSDSSRDVDDDDDDDGDGDNEDDVMEYIPWPETTNPTDMTEAQRREWLDDYEIAWHLTSLELGNSIDVEGQMCAIRKKIANEVDIKGKQRVQERQHEPLFLSERRRSHSNPEQRQILNSLARLNEMAISQNQSQNPLWVPNNSTLGPVDSNQRINLNQIFPSQHPYESPNPTQTLPHDHGYFGRYVSNHTDGSLYPSNTSPHEMSASPVMSASSQRNSGGINYNNHEMYPIRTEITSIGSPASARTSGIDYNPYSPIVYGQRLELSMGDERRLIPHLKFSQENNNGGGNGSIYGVMNQESRPGLESNPLTIHQQLHHISNNEPHMANLGKVQHYKEQMSINSGFQSYTPSHQQYNVAQPLQQGKSTQNKSVFANRGMFSPSVGESSLSGSGEIPLSPGVILSRVGHARAAMTKRRDALLSAISKNGKGTKL
eukprot:m.41155 g.41155  ORF g.41155 m.41155 type:complete len:504 (+) comp9739_c0_seq1:407-1918(+)